MVTKTPIQMIDVEMGSGKEMSHSVPDGYDTLMVYAYEGSGSVVVVEGDKKLSSNDIVLFDANDNSKRSFTINSDENLSFMIFAGKKLNEPIAWRGPIVMNTNQELTQCFTELRGGTFPPKRVKWDYKKIGTKPKGEL